MGFGLLIGYIDHLHVITTNNYNTNADFHTLPISPAHDKSFQSALSRRFLATDFTTVTITVSLNYTLQISL
jgi:hypothetical protein